MKILMVVNPEAGGGKGAKIVNQVRNEFLIRSCEVLEVRTKLQRKGKETLAYGWKEFLKTFSQPPERLVVVGGDGTLNEVVNGLNERVPVAFIPAGTASVFAKE
ncbi:MAG: acylglycerol kinase family protein, partial [candidate division KSB1 bacterium]|nr:acylglycerol kinase family protein [candidate division KSB1 bacterium]